MIFGYKESYGKPNKRSRNIFVIISEHKGQNGSNFLLCILYTTLQIQGCGGAGWPPLANHFKRKTNQGKLYIILKGMYKRLRISANDCKITKFCELVSKIAFG